MAYQKHENISALKYSQPIISSMHGIKFNPKGLWTPKINAKNIAYGSLFEPFDLEQYLYTRHPIDMGLIEEKDWISKINILRMPIKFPKTDYRIPSIIDSLITIIDRVAEYEAFINARHNECFCHITYDECVVQANEHHRFHGFHGDGVQGSKITPKVIIEHSYIIATAPPTEFCLQPFFLSHLDEAKHNFFLELDAQAREDNVLGLIPNHLYLIDPYMVHRSPMIKEETNRKFLRITYTFTELEHNKNTVNPMFDGQEYGDRIDVRSNLCRNEFPVPYNLYGLSGKPLK